MEANQLGEAASLVSQLADLDRVLQSLNEGGRIVEMKIGDEAIPVQTEGLNYPPQMTAAIQQALTERRESMYQQLVGMGITDIPAGGGGGWQPPEQAAPQAAPAPAAARTTPAAPRRR